MAGWAWKRHSARSEGGHSYAIFKLIPDIGRKPVLTMGWNPAAVTPNQRWFQEQLESKFRDIISLAAQNGLSVVPDRLHFVVFLEPFVLYFTGMLGNSVTGKVLGPISSMEDMLELLVDIKIGNVDKWNQ